MTSAQRIGAALALAAACAGSALAQVSAQVSAQQAPITLLGAGPFHRLALPLAIHGRTAFDDLRDLRVRNAAGQAVPFAWVGAEPDAVPRTASARAPLFAVPMPRPGATAAEGPVALALRADGTLGWAAAAAPPSAPVPTAQWIIDASAIHADLVQIRFELAAGAQGLFPFTLDGSDDLRQWHAIAADDQLVRLQHGDQTIERLAVEIDHARVRYVRLRWHHPAQAPALSGVWLDSVEGAEAVPAVEWTSDVRATACGVDYCDYPAPRGLPLHGLRLALAERNTLAALRVSSLLPAPNTPRATPRNALYVLRHGARRTRDAATPQEEVLADTVVYRLDQPGGEARSPALPMDGGVHTTLRLRTNGPVSALGSTPPVLTFGARPRALVFLAQGQAPFTLSWSAAGQPPVRDAAALPLASLMPGHRAGQPIVADAASVAITPVSALPMAPGTSSAAGADPSHKRWLWAALGAGLLVIAGMAWSLLRGLGEARTPPAD